MSERDCENCKHHTEKGCDSWDCNFEPCEDAISRQAVLDATVKKNSVWNHITNAKGENLEKIISQLPPVKPQVICPSYGIDCEDCPAYEPNTGHWISFGTQGKIDGQIVQAFTCSECGAISIFRVSNGNIVNGDLCPNCGAKMVESEVEK